MSTSIRFAVNTNSFSEKSTPGEIGSLLKELGFDGVEWGLPSLEKAEKAAKEMAKASADNGLEIVGFINAGKLWETDLIRRWSDAVAPAEAKMLRVTPPWTAFDFNESLHQKDSFMDLVKLAQEGLANLVPLSQEYNIRYIVEMHMGNVAASACLARNLCEGFDPQAIGIIYDPANGVYEGHLRPRHAVELLGPYLAYVHAKNLIWEPDGNVELVNTVQRKRWKWRFSKLEEGIVDWVEVSFALNVINFNGWVSIEEFSEENKEQEITKWLAFLKECMASAPKKIEEPYTNFND